MGNRWFDLLAGLIAMLGASTLSAQTPPAAAAGAATTESGFVDVLAGYQRLPNPDAHYMDTDPEVAGGADPRWKT